jgi:hypothetical protein
MLIKKIVPYLRMEKRIGGTLEDQVISRFRIGVASTSGDPRAPVLPKGQLSLALKGSSIQDMEPTGNDWSKTCLILRGVF